MRTMDYSVSGIANKPVFEPVSERAKARTQNALRFEDRASALDFMLKSQIEGFRFSGAYLIDPEQRVVKNGYFLKRDGELIPIGSDNGPRVPVWKVGDVMPDELEIEEILDDEQVVPKKYGCAIAFIVKERKTQ